ncbi:DUF87 domain-containing protein [Lachnospiraceae bacterium MD1]|uniref:DUF87 domain-containing protein n=1 Tax=Variimorphobacter saccharofermentans TaxID=2755051 RepID=A0A839K0H1_9FIRM|nr:DUF87 domain-containing protein [Variimorphobacter saccharofermentans]MBB2182231.1 DUF87 domain-containing protein [Variimorphobacter saccharofermentans]
MALIDLVIDEKMLMYASLSSYVRWDTQKSPHLVVSGVTGSGKTYLVKLIIGRISKYITDSQITICDFKGDNSDFSGLIGAKRYYRFDDALRGFNEFYDCFLHRQRYNDSMNFRLILIEEYASLLNYLPKSESEEIKRKLSSLLMLARSFNFHVLLSQQRLDAEYFGKARDNFNVVITLGNVSKEVRDMLFSSYKDEITPDRSRGTGYMITNGADFRRIVVPQINNMDLLNQYIKDAVDR